MDLLKKTCDDNNIQSKGSNANIEQTVQNITSPCSTIASTTTDNFTAEASSLGTESSVSSKHQQSSTIGIDNDVQEKDKDKDQKKTDSSSSAIYKGSSSNSEPEICPSTMICPKSPFSSRPVSPSPSSASSALSSVFNAYKQQQIGSNTVSPLPKRMPSFLETLHRENQSTTARPPFRNRSPPSAKSNETSTVTTSPPIQNLSKSQSKTFPPHVVNHSVVNLTSSSPTNTNMVVSKATSTTTVTLPLAEGAASPPSSTSALNPSSFSYTPATETAATNNTTTSTTSTSFLGAISSTFFSSKEKK
eukprot:Awhi_evm1s358